MAEICHQSVEGLKESRGPSGIADSRVCSTLPSYELDLGRLNFRNCTSCPRRVSTEKNQFGMVNIVGLPLMDQLHERASNAARSLRMMNDDGTGALPGIGLLPSFEGRIQHGSGHDEGHPDPLFARNPSCGTRPRGVPEPCLGSCVTTSLKVVLGDRFSVACNLFLAHNGWRKFIISERFEFACDVGSLLKGRLR